jgi:hypothetical protein
MRTERGPTQSVEADVARHAPHVPQGGPGEEATPCEFGQIVLDHGLGLEHDAPTGLPRPAAQIDVFAVEAVPLVQSAEFDVLRGAECESGSEEPVHHCRPVELGVEHEMAALTLTVGPQQTKR